MKTFKVMNKINLLQYKRVKFERKEFAVSREKVLP